MVGWSAKKKSALILSAAVLLFAGVVAVIMFNGGTPVPPEKGSVLYAEYEGEPEEAEPSEEIEEIEEEPEEIEEPEEEEFIFDENASWVEPLKDFLSEYLPFFTTDTEERINDWDDWSWGWKRFIWYEQDADSWWLEYPDGFRFYDPATGDRVPAGTVPYIPYRQWDNWGYRFDSVAIARHFRLFDLDGDGIPEVVIYWEIDPIWQGSGDGGSPIEIFRYVDGSYVSLYASLVNLHDFTKDEQGQVFVYLMSESGSVMGIERFSINDTGVTITPFIEIRQHEELGAAMDAMFYWWRYGTPPILPIPGSDETLTLIPSLTALQDHLTEIITARLIAEGRVV